MRRTRLLDFGQGGVLPWVLHEVGRLQRQGLGDGRRVVMLVPGTHGSAAGGPGTAEEGAWAMAAVGCSVTLGRAPILQGGRLRLQGFFK